MDAEIPDEDDENHVHMGTEPDEAGFGFVTLDRTHTLASFEAYAKWAKQLHFGLKEGHPSPSVEEIEAEFWRIVETPGEVSSHYFIHQDRPMIPCLSSHNSPCPPSSERPWAFRLNSTET